MTRFKFIVFIFYLSQAGDSSGNILHQQVALAGHKVIHGLLVLVHRRGRPTTHVGTVKKKYEIVVYKISITALEVE
jgi:hypothetical protein